MKVNLNEVIKEAEYADIILSLLASPFQICSVTKIIFISFCVKHEDNMSSYRNRNKDFVDVFFENISLKLVADYRDIEKIIHIIHILVKTNRISINEDHIEIKSEILHSPENEFIKMCLGKTPNPIVEINKLDAIAVLEEVIRYV